MTNTESTKKRTHMVAYTWSGPRGFGPGAIDMTLPNGFADPGTREAIERAILQVNPNATSVLITNVIPYEGRGATDVDALKATLAEVVEGLRDTDGNPAYLAQLAGTLDTLAEGIQ